MAKFIISTLPIYPSPPLLNKFYWPPLIWRSPPIYVSLHFASRRSDFHGLGLQLPKHGRITIPLALSAKLHNGRWNRCFNFYIFTFYVLNLYLISNSRIFVNACCYSTEREVHMLNVQSHNRSDKTEPFTVLITLNPQFICPNCAKETFKYYLVIGDIVIQVFRSI